MIPGNRDPRAKRNAHEGKEVREGLLIHTEENLAAVGEEQGDADRGDEHRQFRLIAQGSVGESLDDDPEHGADQHRPEQDAGGRHPGVGQEAMDDRGCVEAGKSADHQDVTVGEVDELEQPVDHTVAERDQGIDRAEREAVDQLLKKFLHDGEESNQELRNSGKDITEREDEDSTAGGT